MVTNRNGKSEPLNTGPSGRDAQTVTAGTWMSGRTTTMAMASIAMVPTFMKVDR